MGIARRSYSYHKQRCWAKAVLRHQGPRLTGVENQQSRQTFTWMPKSIILKGLEKVGPWVKQTHWDSSRCGGAGVSAAAQGRRVAGGTWDSVASGSPALSTRSSKLVPGKYLFRWNDHFSVSPRLFTFFPFGGHIQLSHRWWLLRKIRFKIAPTSLFSLEKASIL